MRHILISFIFLLPLRAALAQQPCKPDFPPIVFVHGFLSSGDNWASQMQRFAANGYCAERLFAFDWNSTGGKNNNDSLLGIFIDDVLAATGAPNLVLIGHSAGGGLCYNHLKKRERAALIKAYIHIASSPLKKPAGPSGKVPTLVISSPEDKVVPAGKILDSVLSLSIPGKDHLEIATSQETFRTVYNFIHSGKEPDHLEPYNAKGSVEISGKAVTLGENHPLANENINLYLFDEAAGERIGKKPFIRLRTDDQGKWGPVKVPVNSYLEFIVNPADARAISYYLPAPVSNNPAVYLRTIPASGLAANMLKRIPADNKQSAIAIFSANRAIISGRDSVSIDSFSLCHPSLTPASATIIASFIFDDGDGISSGKPLKSMGPGIFINAVDVMIPASEKKKSLIFFNGKKIHLPRKPSDETVLVVVFP